jgi:hypothetical protein
MVTDSDGKTGGAPGQADWKKAVESVIAGNGPEGAPERAKTLAVYGLPCHQARLGGPFTCVNAHEAVKASPSRAATVKKPIL